MKSMLITEEEVKKIVGLARLTVTSQEIKKFQKQLSETLEYVKILKELPGVFLTTTNQVTGLSNISKEDETTSGLAQTEALSGSQSVYNGYFKIKSLF